MNIVDKSIASLFPGWGLSRVRARHLMEVYSRAYEAAKPSRLHKRRTDRGSGDAVVGDAGDSLRIQARHLDENHDLAKGVLNTLVNNVIGTGIRVEPQVKNPKGELLPDVNKALLELFHDWMLYPEVTGELHWYAVQRLATRSWLRDGEMLVQLLEGQISSLDHGTTVPFSLELIEADLLPMELNDDAKGIIQGVEKNKWGMPRAYHLLKEHPGAPGSMFSFAPETKRVRAENIIHLKLVDRIKQTRGVSIFAAVLNRLDDIKDYEESERVAARVAAAMCAFFRKSIDGAPGGENSEATGDRTMKMQPGMIFDRLLPGEDIVTLESKRPNAALEPFRNSQLKAVAAGTSTGYSSIAKDYNGTYSAQRQELVEQSVHYAVLREHFVERFIRPVWQRFVRMALLSGLLKNLPAIKEQSLFDADFRGPSIPWIDPLKEINAEEKAVQAGFKSRSQVIRERGGNPTDVLEQIKREREEEAAYDLVFTTNPASQASPQPDNNTEKESSKETDSEEKDV